MAQYFNLINKKDIPVNSTGEELRQYITNVIDEQTVQAVSGLSDKMATIENAADVENIINIVNEYYIASNTALYQEVVTQLQGIESQLQAVKENPLANFSMNFTIQGLLDETQIELINSFASVSLNAITYSTDIDVVGRRVRDAMNKLNRIHAIIKRENLNVQYADFETQDIHEQPMFEISDQQAISISGIAEQMPINDPRSKRNGVIVIGKNKVLDTGYQDIYVSAETKGKIKNNYIDRLITKRPLLFNALDEYGNIIPDTFIQPKMGKFLIVGFNPYGLGDWRKGHHEVKLGDLKDRPLDKSKKNFAKVTGNNNPIFMVKEVTPMLDYLKGMTIERYDKVVNILARSDFNLRKTLNQFANYFKELDTTSAKKLVYPEFAGVARSTLETSAGSLKDVVNDQSCFNDLEVFGEFMNRIESSEVITLASMMNADYENFMNRIMVHAGYRGRHATRSYYNYYLKAHPFVKVSGDVQAIKYPVVANLITRNETAKKVAGFEQFIELGDKFQRRLQTVLASMTKIIKETELYKDVMIFGEVVDSLIRSFTITKVYQNALDTNNIISVGSIQQLVLDYDPNDLVRTYLPRYGGKLKDIAKMTTEQYLEQGREIKFDDAIPVYYLAAGYSNTTNMMRELAASSVEVTKHIAPVWLESLIESFKRFDFWKNNLFDQFVDKRNETVADFFQQHTNYAPIEFGNDKTNWFSYILLSAQHYAFEHNLVTPIDSGYRAFLSGRSQSLLSKNIIQSMRYEKIPFIQGVERVYTNNDWKWKNTYNDTTNVPYNKEAVKHNLSNTVYDDYLALIIDGKFATSNTNSADDAVLYQPLQFDKRLPLDTKLYPQVDLPVSLSEINIMRIEESILTNQKKLRWRSLNDVTVNGVSIGLSILVKDTIGKDDIILFDKGLREFSELRHTFEIPREGVNQQRIQTTKDDILRDYEDGRNSKDMDADGYVLARYATANSAGLVLDNSIVYYLLPLRFVKVSHANNFDNFQDNQMSVYNRKGAKLLIGIKDPYSKRTNIYVNDEDVDSQEREIIGMPRQLTSLTTMKPYISHDRNTAFYWSSQGEKPVGFYTQWTNGLYFNSSTGIYEGIVYTNVAKHLDSRGGYHHADLHEFPTGDKSAYLFSRNSQVIDSITTKIGNDSNNFVHLLRKCNLPEFTPKKAMITLDDDEQNSEITSMAYIDPEIILLRNVYDFITMFPEYYKLPIHNNYDLASIHSKAKNGSKHTTLLLQSIHDGYSPEMNNPKSWVNYITYRLDERFRANYQALQDLGFTKLYLERK